MRRILVAATGLPTILPTRALVAVACPWLLACLTDVGSFDADVDLWAWRLDGVPVSVALSLLTVLGWTFSVSVVVLLTTIESPGHLAGPLCLAAAAGAPLLAWTATHLIVQPLRQLSPDERDEQRGPDEPLATAVPSRKSAA
ncbi:hypothetical protein ACFVHS_46345 [Streptomyces sp. NPDC057746]|uniref:hypothetical protein n=1 Tax=Streptomyces sp. NPDC057746 TaxID=3346237 RepID=UPI0036747389